MTDSRGEAGFSLVETLVAMSLMALVAVSVYSVFSSSLHGSDKGQAALRAGRLAEVKIHELADPDLRVYGTESGIDGERFMWRREIARFVDSPIPDAVIELALVTVTVVWSEGRNGASYHLQTVVPIGGGQ